ncbi:MAG TPA: DUF3800 domain-containing protein [Acidimicrobiales bacterium]|nr:DUF3800 domain-containing protein [Acidimicrobiales bacterium]
MSGEARTPTSTFYLDDSGVLAAGSRLLVIAGIKIRRHGKLMREIRHIRDKADFRREFKFSEINKGSLSAYYAMIEALADSDAHLIACVAKRPHNSGWRFYGSLTSQVVRGNVNRGELVGVLMDTISTPQHVALEDVVRGRVNRELKSTSVVTAVCLDSRCSDGLQVADLIAGAIGFDRRRTAGESGKVTSAKGRVVERLKSAFDVPDLGDRRTGRVNIHTWKEPPPPRGEPQGDARYV